MTKRRVLVVDDDILFANFLADTLSEFKIKIVHDSLTAIDEIDNFKPEAIVLDLLMPASTGFALLNELASYADTGRLPVIICSNAVQGLNQETLKASGVVAVVDKSSMQPLDVYYQLRHCLGDGD